MTDETTWTEKFDRWWAEHGEPLSGRIFHACLDHRMDDTVLSACRAAFMAGAAAERAEHPDAQLKQQMEQIRESERAAERRHHLR